MKAFPVTPINTFDGGIATSDQQGMDLRDYGAFKALQGFCANPATFAHNPRCGWGLVNCTETELSKYCYALADVMMKVREE